MLPYADLQSIALLESIAPMVQMAVGAQPVRSARSLIVCGVSSQRGGVLYEATPFFDAFQNVWNAPGVKTPEKFYPTDGVAKSITTILKQPRHGVFTSDSSKGSYQYKPDDKFSGTDNFAIRVESQGRKTIDIYYKIMVFPDGADWGFEHDCKQPPFVPFPKATM